MYLILILYQMKPVSSIGKVDTSMQIRGMRDIGLYACGALLSRFGWKWTWNSSFIGELAGSGDRCSKLSIKRKLDSLDIDHKIVGINGIEQLLPVIRGETNNSKTRPEPEADSDASLLMDSDGRKDVSVTICNDLRDTILSAVHSKDPSHEPSEDEPELSEPAENASPCRSAADACQKLYRDNPYVASCTGSRLQMSETFSDYSPRQAVGVLTGGNLQ